MSNFEDMCKEMSDSLPPPPPPEPPKPNPWLIAQEIEALGRELNKCDRELLRYVAGRLRKMSKMVYLVCNFSSLQSLTVTTDEPALPNFPPDINIPKENYLQKPPQIKEDP